MSITRVTFPLLLCALALAGPALAQTAPADTARFYKHHLGLTASPVLDHFFTANRSLPVGLLYKRQTTAHWATRYGLVGSYRYDSFTDNNPLPTSNDDRSTSLFSVGLYIGREYSRAFSRRWSGIAGLDLGVSYARGVFKSTSFVSANPFLTQTNVWARSNEYSAQVRPFVALRFYVQPQLYVSAESAFQVYYQQYDLGNRSSIVRLDTNEHLVGPTSASFTDRTWRTQLQLIRQLSLHYQIGRR